MWIFLHPAPMCSAAAVRGWTHRMARSLMRWCGMNRRMEMGQPAGGSAISSPCQPGRRTPMSPSVNDQHSGRGVPDVSGDADPETGYQVYVDGQSAPIGGTSAVAPLWAGLLALVNQKRGKAVGYLNPYLYQNYQQLSQSKALRDVTSGNNGAYSAGPGWDACTGLGTPDGSRLLQALLASGG